LCDSAHFSATLKSDMRLRSHAIWLRTAAESHSNTKKKRPESLFTLTDTQPKTSVFKFDLAHSLLILFVSIGNYTWFVVGANDEDLAAGSKTRIIWMCG